MTVKSALKTAPPDSIEKTVRELAGMMGRVWKGLKHRGSPEPPSALEDAFDDPSIGRRHMPVLMTVTFDGPLSVSELAERIGLTVATTSLLVGELSRAGLVDRSEDDQDRRRTLVTLPEKYRKDMEPWFEERLEPIRNTLERLPPKARAHFMEGWRILDEETGGPAADGPDC
jgi:DNA-binding MarR family transcriptional regulator